MNMETRHLSLVVESSYADLVINAGKVTFGEENRNKLQKTQRDQEKEKVSQAACALLNSGGGVVLMEMANNDEHPVELGLDLEESLRTLIQSSDLQTFFETKQEGRHFYLFVKSWRPDPSSEDDAIKPRICSLGSSLYRRSGTSVLLMKPREALNFLKDKEKKTKFLENEPPNKILKESKQDSRTLTPAEQTFQRDQLQRGEILPFPESPSVEFKQFSTKRIQQYVKNIIPEYISAFANTGNGYLFIGVDDKSKKVLGCAKENFDRDSLSEIIEDAINKLICVHFCRSRCQITFTLKFMDVLEEGQVYGHVCAIRVQRFCCAVFSEAPKSWLVRGGQVCRLTTKEWVDMVMDRDPDLECLSEDFESQLSLSSGPPRCRPVYSKKGLEHKKDLQQLLFPVPSEGVQYKPESLWRELSSEHKGLKKLINKQMHPLSLGVLVFSRSWAVDLNLPEKPEVICDVLLVTQDSVPILYTVLREQDADGQLYCTRIASTLKQKLVNTGGYTGKLYVMPRVLQLSPESHAEPSEGSGSLTDYPESYHLADTQQMTTLLQSLVVVLLGFRSFLSDQVGCEILNLLTAQQYKIISKNLHKTRELFIHGSPGTGKTIIAMKIMEKIKNMFGCEENEILYVCENQPLRDFIGNKNICYAVTRKTFMRTDIKNIKHIIIDEAQNFRTEDGDWYKKAKTITQTGKDNLGILWIFLDYFQTSHGAESGLPSLGYQNPIEELTKVVRNADQIANYLQERMDVVRENPPPNIPAGSLKMLSQTEWVQGVPGKCKIRKLLNLDQLVAYITQKCQFFLKQGYSCKDIAMLCSTASDIEKYKSMLQTAMRKRKSSESSEEADLIRFRNASDVTGNHIVLDSVRRFSGLERNIVFGVDPQAAEPAVFNNLLLCLASRARKHLYILMLIKES
ncbi:schlafen family member 11 [Sturnira hondurensis]|uniref:schlafen family member 11 n=1 Tax=Sturnira hondurensis TaxID=192404 RepID=UPI0018798AAC|nr:schlafen family member 11 [Sturnira hondurensis]XP_036922630.1 schlafen family member 11 [Sturnira hondurensis]XP_036922640.1 schlafen family member 11 [Sturnira hondurensis]XP_036922649.1 schlafen family member 11 [Sturnira hondurensis]